MENWTEQLFGLLNNNRPLLWLSVALICLAVTLIIKFVIGLISQQLRKITQRTHSIWDDVGVDLIDGLKRFTIFIWLFYVCSKSMDPTPALHKLLLIATVAFTVFQLGLWGHHIIANWKKSFLDPRITHDPSSAAALGLLYTAVQVIFLVIIGLIGLSNLGINIGALLAGLGVGGIAVALAAQNVLGDLLASLSIVLDKPFIVGDFIISGKEMGTVEDIGIKTTRLRSLSGEQIIMANKSLIESRIQNFKRMSTRRIVVAFGVTYNATSEQLRNIPVWVKEFVAKQEKLTFDRCHLAKLGESALEFELVFIVQSADYNIYMDLQQFVLWDIYDKLNAEGIGFAFPTRTVNIESVPKALLETRRSPAPGATVTANP